MSRLNTIIVVTRKHVMNAEKRRGWGQPGMNAEKRGGGEGIPFCQNLRLQIYLVLISKISSIISSLTFNIDPLVKTTQL